MSSANPLARPLKISPATGVSDYARSLFFRVGEDPEREGASVGYLPTDKTLGLSKSGRAIDVYSKRFQVQEMIRLLVQLPLRTLT